MELKCDVSNCAYIRKYIHEYSNMDMRINVGEKGKTL